MRSIIKDIEDNCPKCECNTEETVKFLQNRGDFSFTANHYREVWNFYKEKLSESKNKRRARETTQDLYFIKHDKFKHIQRWAKKVGIST